MCYADEQGTHVLAEVEIAAEGHLIVHHEATETNSEYWECAVCGELFSDEAGSTQISAIPAAEEDNTGEVVGLSVGGAAVAELGVGLAAAEEVGEDDDAEEPGHDDGAQAEDIDEAEDVGEPELSEEVEEQAQEAVAEQAPNNAVRRGRRRRRRKK